MGRHTVTIRGKRVVVTMRNGDVFVDKFVCRQGRFVVFEEAGRLRRRDVKTVADLKGPLDIRRVKGGDS